MAPASHLGQVELLAGDSAAAEAAFRPGFEALERMGEKSFLSTLAAWLANALYAEKRYEEAAALMQASEAAASPDDVVSQVGWRSVRAKLLSRRGAGKEAERLARDAVGLAERTDMPDLRGDALWALAEVLDGTGEAASTLGQTAAAFEQKENDVSAARARAARDELLHSPS